MQTLHQDIVNVGDIADCMSGRKLKITSKMCVEVVFRKDIKGGKNQRLAYFLKKYLVYFLYVIDVLKKRYKDLFSKYAETNELSF